jgi:RimJ/RimL family protein N-acetyltransferase
MLEPIYLDKGPVFIHHFRTEELARFGQLAREIYQILSDEETLCYIPEKRLHSVAEAESWLQNAILNFHCGRSFIHFITDKRSGKLLGMIDIVSPERAKEYYRLKKYPHFVEFYLRSNAKGRNIMSGVLPRVMMQLHQQGIPAVAAVINRRNHAAFKVLSRSGFTYQFPFDRTQDLYQSCPADELSKL